MPCPNRLTVLPVRILLVRVCIRSVRIFSCLNCSACPCLVWPRLAPESSCLSCPSGLFESSESFKLSGLSNCSACPCLASESSECLARPYLAPCSSSFRIILCRVRISAKLCGFRQGRADSCWRFADCTLRVRIFGSVCGFLIDRADYRRYVRIGNWRFQTFCPRKVRNFHLLSPDNIFGAI